MTRELAIGLKPVWLIGVGTLAGLIFIALFYLLLLVAHRRAAAAMLDILCNRLVMPVLTVAVILSTFSVGMTVNDELFGGRFFDRKMDALTSVVRFPMVGLRARDVEIDAGARDQIVALNVPDGELKQITLSSTEPLTIAVNKTTQEADILTHERFEILRQEPFSWSRPREATGPWSGEVSRLQVNSDNNVAATLHIFYETTVTVPEAKIIPYAAVGLIAYVGIYLCLQMFFPKIAAVALTTGKEAVNQPLFRLTLALGGFLILIFVVVPYFTFGDDVKMYKESCLQIIMLLAMFVAVWTASVAVADEIEGRTALTVLSKPIGRQQFIIGKYVGITSALGLLFMLLGTLFVICVSYKVIYDGRESADYYITWQDSSLEIMRTLPGLVLAFMEASVLASISVAISTRLSILANLTICMGVYVVGHLLPLFVQSSVGEFAIVEFMGQLFATVLPVLEHFNIYAAIAMGESVPLAYIVLVGVYSAIYITIAMLLALALFDDRDLA